MSLADVVRFCIRCGSADCRRKGSQFVCGHCSEVFYINAAPAVVVFIEDVEGRLLVIRRAVEPRKGKLAFPGGFVDAGERAEEALIREVREEVGLELLSMEYLDSFPNRYLYKGVTYDTLDLFYIGRVESFAAQALDDVDSVAYLKPEEIEVGEIAFVSQVSGFKAYLERREERD